jgi:hypothetical protein
MVAPLVSENGLKKVRQLEQILKKCYSAIALMSSMAGAGEALFLKQKPIKTQKKIGYERQKQKFI